MVYKAYFTVLDFTQWLSICYLIPNESLLSSILGANEERCSLKSQRDLQPLNKAAKCWLRACWPVNGGSVTTSYGRDVFSFTVLNTYVCKRVIDHEMRAFLSSLWTYWITRYTLLWAVVQEQVSYYLVHLLDFWNFQLPGFC